MPTLNTVDPSIFYALFKGDPGTRKSTQALSFPGKQYWFSWDRKMSGILIPARKWGIDTSRIEYDDYEDWGKAEKKLEALQVDCPHQNLIFDSITSGADMILRQTLKVKTESGNKKSGMMIAGIPINEIEDYNAESSALNSLIALTKDIQNYNKKLGKTVNIILIAHVMDVSVRELNGKVRNSRTIVTAGKRVAAKLPAYCGEVYHFHVKKAFVDGAPGEYACLTEGTGDDFARTALGLDSEIVFNDKPLYQNWIAPAIERMKSDPDKKIMSF